MIDWPVAILAGGIASRLGSLTEAVPKSLIEVAGRPFVLHQLAMLRQQGLQNVVLCVGHLGAQIQNVVGDGQKWGVNVTYSEDGPRLLGTGGALRRALPFLDEQFFVLYGDSYLDCDFQMVGETFLRLGKLGLMTILRNDDQWDQSNIEYDGHHIIAYDKRNPGPGMHFIDYGLGVFSAEALATYEPERVIDLEQVYQDLLSMDELGAQVVTNRFYEIGSPGGLAETRIFLSHVLESER